MYHVWVACPPSHRTARPGHTVDDAASRRIAPKYLSWIVREAVIAGMVGKLGRVVKSYVAVLAACLCIW